MKIQRLLPLIGLLIAAILSAQTKTPYEPLSMLYQYPSFATCADYAAATAKPCPAWNAHKPPKSWFDPAPKKALTVAGVPFTVYERVFVRFEKEEAIFDQLGISVEDAGSVNIAPKGTGTTNTPGAEVKEVPVPLKAPSATQKIVPGFGNVPQVRNLDVAIPEEVQSQQQGDILKLVRAIAAKLGVE